MSRTAAPRARRSRAIQLALYLGLIVGMGAFGVACSPKSAERAPSPLADTLGNGLPVALVPLLSPWTAMWRAAMPGFDLDSLAFAGRVHAFGAGHVQGSPSGHPGPSGEAIFAVLGAASPNRRYLLVFDAYQVVGEFGRNIEIGGEPDSAPLLIDQRLGVSNRFEFCGTPCGYHWGCWIDSVRFALAGWAEVGAGGDSLRGVLGVYSLADSSQAQFVTRPVPRATFEKYRAAWHDWVRARYLAWKVSRPEV